MSLQGDDHLWRRARAGDGDAFADVYHRHAHAIYNYLFRRTGDWSEAEDLTAIVFLEAFRTRDRIPTDGILPWLYGVATNVLRNRRRSQFRHRRALASLAEQPRPVEPDATERAEAAEQMRHVLAIVKALSRDQQDVLALCVWSGLSYDDAAAALGVPVGTVRSRLARARKALAELNEPSRHEREVHLAAEKGHR